MPHDIVLSVCLWELRFSEIQGSEIFEERKDFLNTGETWLCLLRTITNLKLQPYCYER